MAGVAPRHHPLAGERGEEGRVVGEPAGEQAGLGQLLLEARLLTVDRVVLGGLDEGVWPPKAETDAFLNRDTTRSRASAVKKAG
jgi:hypothetical protein